MEEKQIEERKKIIRDICPFYKEYGTCEQCNTALDIDGEPCYFECMANAIINNDYRKQSKWISVDERLPEKSGDYLTYHNGVITALMYSKRHKLFNAEDSLDEKFSKANCIEVSHWMPLPEAPKGVEGAPKKTYYTPEEVRNMSMNEIRDNITAIRESMKRWRDE